MAKILIIEDESDLATPTAAWLRQENHLVEIVSNGASAVSQLGVYKYDVIILDLMLPDLNGLEVCRRYRASAGKTPILMLTARDTIDDKAVGLDAGADDYMTKPFHLKELAARVRALLRRPVGLSGDTLTAGKLVLDTRSCQVCLDGRALHLEPREYNLLTFFMHHPRQVFSSDTLLDRVWASDSLAGPDTVRTHIKTLRRKIDLRGQPSLITNIHGQGYRFEGCDV